MRSNEFLRAKLQNDSDDPTVYKKEHVEVHPLDANLISSKKANGKHVLFLDLDQNNKVVPSSTHGHTHIYVDTDLDLAALKEIVDVLAKHGIVQEGIKRQLDEYGFLTLRPPGVVKGNPADDADLETAKAMKEITPAVPQHQLKELSPKFKELKDKLKNGGMVTSGEIQNAFVEKEIDLGLELFTIIVSEEVIEDSFKQILNALGLDSVMSYINMQPLVNDGPSGYVYYLGKTFCYAQYDATFATYVIRFYQKSFYESQFPGLTWDKVKAVLTQLFGG